MTTTPASTTSTPSNASEWQLYRVLQRANLLQYYDVFVAQGGDDVQQLCEAGEEEFLEIMALVGMASKPLHVRRLQKALQEWVANPAAFQRANVTPPAPVKVASLVNSQARDPGLVSYTISSTSPTVGAAVWSPHQPAIKSVSPINTMGSNGTSSQGTTQSGESTLIIEKSLSSSPIPTPVLVESQINTIAQSAARLVKTLPAFEPKPLNMKKDIHKQIQMVMQMSEDDPNRLEQMRKFAAIYGRFDSKRRNDRPMSLHEISVNEAAAQLCCHIPNLLTRREDLFPLARQIVKDSGYHYSKGHSRASELDPQNPSKKQKIDSFLTQSVEPSFLRIARVEMEKLQREDRLAVIGRELTQVSARQDEINAELEQAKENNNAIETDRLQSLLEQTTNKHLLLLSEQSDLQRKQSYNYSSGEYPLELVDSNQASGSSSPILSDSQDGTDAQLKAILANSMLTNQLVRNSQGKDLKNTLFDEGLRIAQQYGMADFELEIKQMKGDPDEGSNESENSRSFVNVSDDGKVTAESGKNKTLEEDKNPKIVDEKKKETNKNNEIEEKPRIGVRTRRSSSLRLKQEIADIEARSQEVVSSVLKQDVTSPTVNGD